MTSILSADEILHRAIRWISDEHRERPDQTLLHLVDEAALRFDLSPAQHEWLRLTMSCPETERAIP